MLQYTSHSLTLSGTSMDVSLAIASCQHFGTWFEIFTYLGASIGTRRYKTPHQAHERHMSQSFNCTQHTTQSSIGSLVVECPSRRDPWNKQITKGERIFSKCQDSRHMQIIHSFLWTLTRNCVSLQVSRLSHFFIRERYYHIVLKVMVLKIYLQRYGALVRLSPLTCKSSIFLLYCPSFHLSALFSFKKNLVGSVHCVQMCVP